ncbi:hypothetical protein A45J_0948 [hot springs metagenome]|uniref:histidine kinase n=1 Tax=hot springs metagenome TaxID=433727 RepID=A0A5J4L1U1_9ZZZZ
MKIAEWEPKIKCTKSLIFKTTVLLIIGLFVVISIFSHTNIMLTEKRLLEIASNEASKTSDAVKGSLKNAMLSNNRQVIDSIISTVSNEASIEDIKILDISGQIKYAKDSSEVGMSLDRTKIKSCNICHASAVPPRNNLTVIFEKTDGSKILRNVNPIDNEKECFSCHDQSQKVLGKLLVDFKINDLQNIVKGNRKILIASAAATLITALIIVAAVLVIYLKPKLHNLTKNIRKTAEGNYDTHIKVKGQDEIAVLSQEFNNMINAIKQRDEKIKNQLKTFTTIYDVSSILKRAESLQEDIMLILNTLEMGLNIEQCTILFIDDTGNVELKGYVGLTQEDADLVRLVIEEMFEISKMPVSREKEEIKAVIGEKDKILGDEVFIAAGDGKLIRDFIIAPLKAGGRVIGAITVHKIKDSDIHASEIKDTISIIATAMSPYIHIGLCLEKRASMQESPFDALIATIQRNIERAEQYQGGLSLIIIKAENYEDIIKKIGTIKASDNIRKALIEISAFIDKVHEIIRMTENSAAIILPIVAESEALDIVHKATGRCTNDIVWQFKSAYYPDDGTLAEEILHKATEKFL